jgi:hypothetical protein
MFRCFKDGAFSPIIVQMRFFIGFHPTTGHLRNKSEDQAQLRYMSVPFSFLFLVAKSAHMFFVGFQPKTGHRSNKTANQA